MLKALPLVLITLLFWSCTAPSSERDRAPASAPETALITTLEPRVKIASAMRNVMWQGELEGKIKLDTIAKRDHLFALGPVSYLRGEIMAVDGKVYVSRVTEDSSMSVEIIPDVAAPFLVYADVAAWRKTDLPATVTTIPELEKHLDAISKDLPRPFAFKLEGSIADALIHVQNLAPGTRVSSPKEAHQGQVKYPVGEAKATIVGFFSTEHQGIFTHHDTYLHMHLLTADKTMMGHLDALNIGRMELYLGQ